MKAHREVPRHQRSCCSLFLNYFIKPWAFCVVMLSGINASPASRLSNINNTQAVQIQPAEKCIPETYALRRNGTAIAIGKLPLSGNCREPGEEFVCEKWQPSRLRRSQQKPCANENQKQNGDFHLHQRNYYGNMFCKSRVELPVIHTCTQRNNQMICLKTP